MRARMTSFKTRTILLTGMVVAGLLGNRSVNAVASSSGTFTLTGSLNTARRDHTATLLQNGEVLVAGGRTLIIILPLHSRAPNCITQLRASGP